MGQGLDIVRYLWIIQMRERGEGVFMQPFIKVILIILAVLLVVWGTEWLLTEHVIHKFSNKYGG
jgi:hypothetical protein